MDEAEEKRWSRWEPEDGYEDNEDIHHEIPHGVDVDEALKDEDLPRRSLSPGLHSGLTLLLNVEKDEYHCSGTESAGFKVRPENQFSDLDQCRLIHYLRDCFTCLRQLQNWLNMVSVSYLVPKHSWPCRQKSFIAHMTSYTSTLAFEIVLCKKKAT